MDHSRSKFTGIIVDTSIGSATNSSALSSIESSIYPYPLLQLDQARPGAGPRAFELTRCLADYSIPQLLAPVLPSIDRFPDQLETVNTQFGCSISNINWYLAEEFEDVEDIIGQFVRKFEVQKPSIAFLCDLTD